MPSTIRLHRVLRGTPQRVYKAFTDAAAQAKWLPPYGFTCTVHQFEAGTSEPRRATLQVIRQAFEAAGVEFIDDNGGGPGVRLRKLP